jgi:hypothetical protein
MKFISYFVVYSTFSTLNQAYVSAEPSRMRQTSNRADLRGRYYNTMEMLQRRNTAARTREDGDLSSSSSLNFISVHQSEATSFDTDVATRRTQASAACAANPVCAAAGLVDDCCPTRAGMFLECCSQTDPPGTFSLQ